MAIGHATDARTLNQIWVHCRSHVEPTIFDAWTEGGALLKFLSDERYAGTKVMRTLAGGADIRVPEEFEAIPAYNWSGYDIHPLQASDVWTKVKWDWRGIMVPFGVSFAELFRTNGEKEAIGSLLKNKTKNAVNSISERVTLELLRGNESSDGLTYDVSGTLGDGPMIDGLRFAFNYQNDQADDYGGIGRAAAHSWFRHEIQDIGGNVFTAATGVVSAEPLFDYLDEYIRKCTHGKPNERVNLLLTTRRTMDNIAKRARFTPTPAQLIVRKNLIDLKIDCVEYGGIPIIWEPILEDNLAGAVGEAGHCVYGLNSKYLRFYVHRDANMKLGDLEKMPNQLVYRTDLIWYGNFASLNPRFNFVLFGGDAPAIT